MIYLLLFAGLFMGWSLGTNDAANAFGTAVATRVVKYRTAIIIIATMVILGSVLQGSDDIDKLSSISTNNEVSADVHDMEKLGYVFQMEYKTKDDNKDGIKEIVFNEENGKPEITYSKDSKGNYIIAFVKGDDGAYVQDDKGNYSIPLMKDENGNFVGIADVADSYMLEYLKDKDGNVLKDETGNYELVSFVCFAENQENPDADNIIKMENGEFAFNVDVAARNTLKLKSAIKAAIIFICAALTVFVMSYLKFPVSANQAVTGAIIGWGLFHANYKDPDVLSTNLKEIGKFMSTWLINPLGAAVIAFVIVFIFKKFFETKVESLKGYDKVIKIGYIVAGAYSAYTIGINSSASVTAFYYDSFGVGANILTNARLTAILGGVAIAVGVLTYSKKVMMTVGGSIANISQIDGFLVILSSALAITLMKQFMGIPVSTSQAVVGAVVGAGLVKGPKNVNFGVFKRIAIAWVSSPTVAGLMTYIIALCSQSVLS